MKIWMKESLKKYKNMPLPIKASMWFLICSVLQRSISFFTVPIFTRILTTAQYGLFNVYQSWMSIIIIFATLNLPYGSFDTAMSKFEDDRDRYLSSIQMLTTILTILMILIYIVGYKFWNSIFQLPTVLMLCMFAEMLTTPAIIFFTGKQRFDYKYKSLIIITLGMSVASPIIGIIVVMSSENKGVARIMAAAFVNVLVGFLIYIYNTFKGKTFFIKKYWKYALSFNIPLIPYYLSQMILNQSDRLMINSMSGPGKAGIYSVAYSLAFILTFVLTAINNSFVPWTFKKLKERDYSAIGKIADSLSVIVASLLLLLIAFAPEVISLLAAKEYYEAIWVIPPVAASLFFLFQAQLSINIEFYFEENFFLVKASLLTAVSNIALNFIFIRIFGYLAAGYTTLLCYIIFSMSNYYFMKKVFRKHIDKDNDIKIYNTKHLAIMSIGFVCASMLLMLLYKLLLIRYIILAIGLMLIFIKRKYIINKINIIRK